MLLHMRHNYFAGSRGRHEISIKQYQQVRLALRVKLMASKLDSYTRLRASLSSCLFTRSARRLN
eukprot:6200527-Pleurochrysis_carterae.AAC.2